LAAELGVRPAIWWDLYIFDINLGVLIHPYDDRGLDVVGPNQEAIRKLYTENNEWLLDYDLEKMRSFYEQSSNHL
jgi:hypothetical protein